MLGRLDTGHFASVIVGFQGLDVCTCYHLLDVGGTWAGNIMILSLLRDLYYSSGATGDMAWGMD